MKFKAKKSIPRHFHYIIYNYFSFRYSSKMKILFFHSHDAIKYRESFFILFSHYNITESSLVVKHGFIFHTEIPFEDIRHVKYSGKNFIQKWTRQQLEIHYNLFDSVTTFVPLEEEKFISLLKENCPQMKVMNTPANK